MGILYFNNLNVSIKVWYIYTGDGEITSSFHLKAVWYVLIGIFFSLMLGISSGPSIGLIVLGMVKKSKLSSLPKSNRTQRFCIENKLFNLFCDMPPQQLIQ